MVGVSFLTFHQAGTLSWRCSRCSSRKRFVPCFSSPSCSTTSTSSSLRRAKRAIQKFTLSAGFTFKEIS